MKREGEKGAVTVFLCIILLAVIIFAGVLVDAARMRAGEEQVKRAVESAAKSTLAGYDNNLKENYGIFALHENNTKVLESTMKNYIEENLAVETGHSMVDLYDFKVEAIKVTPIFNLTENEAARNQIVEYMKYRAPKQMVDGFLDKAGAIADTGKISGITEMKMDIDKLFLDVEQYQERTGPKLDEVNRFKNQQYGQSYLNPYIEELRKYRECLSKIKTLVNTIQQPETGSKDRHAVKQAQKELDALNTELSDLSDRRDRAYENAIKNFDAIVACNKEALELVLGLQDCIRQLRTKITGLREYLDKEIPAASSEYLKKCKAEVILSLNKIEDDTPAENEVSQAAAELKINIENLESFLSRFKVFDKEYGHSADNEVDVGSKMADISQPLKNCNGDIHIGFKNIKRSTGEKADDPRKDAQRVVKNQLEEKAYEDKVLKENYMDLPSYCKDGQYPNKAVSTDFTKEDEEFKKKYDVSVTKDKQLTESQTDNRTTAVNTFDNLGQDVSFDDNSRFSLNALTFVKNLGEKLGRILEEKTVELRDEIYVDEYIMGTFNNAVPELSDKTSTIYDLRGNIKEKAIDNEIEYILWGNTSVQKNLNLIKSQILLIRFAVDTAEIYRQPQKVEAALAIAAAAGSWSFGLAVPFTENLILCGWGMIDAVNDLDAVMKGAAVPLFKKYDSKDKAAKELRFTYHDFLRVFLLMEPSEQKMNRVEDLIQLRTGDKLSGYNTYLRVEAEVSMKYLFMTQAFMPKKFKTSDGARHRFKVLIYQGY